jgi:hypothetical protein
MFEPVTSDDAKLPDKMTSSNFPLSNSDFPVVATAFAVERQVLTPELSQLFANPLRWGNEDKQKIAAGLLLCLSLTVGQTIGDVTIERLDRLPPTGRDRGLIDFKLICRLGDLSQVHLGICVLPFADREIVDAACNLLLVYKDFGLDRLCLLRQNNLMIDASQLPTCLPRLLSADIGGHLIPLKFKDLLTILTTLSVFQHKQQHQIANDSIFAYLLQSKQLIENELINSIIMAAQAKNAH